MTIITVLLWILPDLLEASIYLSRTQDGSALEHYDCVSVGSLVYCRRPRYPMNLSRSDEYVSCDKRNGGITHRFSHLRSMNMNTSAILHEWKSSVDQVEAYRRYLNDSSERDDYLCECSRAGTFGKYCEYQLPIGTTFEETLNWQVETRNRNEWEVQAHGNITCYEGILCNFGLLCLDWREICDGTQNCMFGLDEANCDILELNICDDDEYRCMNGMCIPDKYFLDGEPDCLDWTDEVGEKAGLLCPRQRVSVQCDDHICLPNRWSCGDGQCIQDRFVFQTDFYFKACVSRRDQYYMCETHYMESALAIGNIWQKHQVIPLKQHYVNTCLNVR